MIDLDKLANTPAAPMETESRPHGSVNYDDTVEMMVDELLASRRYNSSMFLNNIAEWGTEKGWLTAAQYDKLQEIYDEYTGG